ncbi:hypothetical protein [Onishia taeanensis]
MPSFRLLPNRRAMTHSLAASLLGLGLAGAAGSALAQCGANPCAVKNPCAAQQRCAPNPCASKNPCAAANPCAAKNPCAANPCAVTPPCTPCEAGAQ